MLLGLMALASATTIPSERIVAFGDIVTGSVNSTPIRMRIDPAGTAMPLIDSDIAHRAGLKHTMFGFMFSVGPQKVAGATAVTKLDLGEGAIKRRIGWTPRRFAASAEGVVGPGGLPEAVIRFQLRASRPGERSFTLPMVDQGGVMSGWGERFASITIGGQPMRVLFDPYHRHTLATAGAAVRIAAAYKGTLVGAPDMAEIAFGIARPVRTMTLATPLPIGPFAIHSLGVRTSDFGSAAGVPDFNADPDEVVITAKGKHDIARDRINIGSDLLDRCSTIVFDNARKRITLSCAP